MNREIFGPRYKSLACYKHRLFETKAAAKDAYDRALIEEFVASTRSDVSSDTAAARSASSSTGSSPTTDSTVSTSDSSHTVTTAAVDTEVIDDRSGSSSLSISPFRFRLFITDTYFTFRTAVGTDAYTRLATTAGSLSDAASDDAAHMAPSDDVAYLAPSDAVSQAPAATPHDSFAQETAGKNLSDATVDTSSAGVQVVVDPVSSTKASPRASTQTYVTAHGLTIAIPSVWRISGVCFFTLLLYLHISYLFLYFSLSPLAPHKCQLRKSTLPFLIGAYNGHCCYGGGPRVVAIIVDIVYLFRSFLLSFEHVISHPLSLYTFLVFVRQVHYHVVLLS